MYTKIQTPNAKKEFLCSSLTGEVNLTLTVTSPIAGAFPVRGSAPDGGMFVDPKSWKLFVEENSKFRSASKNDRPNPTPSVHDKQ